MTATELDPFAGAEKTPAVSFKDKPIGTSYTLEVTGPAQLLQSRDYESGDLASWPDGNPKMSAVINVVQDGEAKSVWAAKPSALFRALADAQDAAGATFAAGGTLTIRLSGEKPNEKNPRLNPQKLYEAVYAPPNAFAERAGTDADVVRYPGASDALAARLAAEAQSAEAAAAIIALPEGVRTSLGYPA